MRDRQADLEASKKCQLCSAGLIATLLLASAAYGGDAVRIDSVSIRGQISPGRSARVTIRGAGLHRVKKLTFGQKLGSFAKGIGSAGLGVAGAVVPGGGVLRNALGGALGGGIGGLDIQGQVGSGMITLMIQINREATANQIAALQNMAKASRGLEILLEWEDDGAGGDSSRAGTSKTGTRPRTRSLVLPQRIPVASGG